MWSDDKKQHFVANIKPEWEQGLITDIDNSDCSIDAICDKLKNVFLEAANATLGQEKEIVINTKTKKHKPWFNNEVKEMRQTYNRARRQNKMQKNENSKNNLKKVSKSYKKLVNKEKAKFKKAQIQKLKYAKSKNPKFYWSVINKRSRSQMNLPSIMEFYSSFKKLAGKPENTDDSDTVESVNQQRVLNIEENEILNGEFTNEEILKCIRNLKNGKASGYDKILNEYIKSSCDILMPVYVKLFNRVLNDGQLPQDWLIGMILPIYKNKGSPEDCDNYRGITLLSCLGKLFTCLLN